MKSLIQCIVLLACAAICTSASNTIESCRCLSTSKGVKPSLIANVELFRVRPYCRRVEVIITLKDKTQRCLNPRDKFTQAVLQTIQRQRAEQAAKMSSSVFNSTTVSASVNATVTPTSS